MKGLAGLIAVLFVGFVIYLYAKQSGGAPSGLGSGADSAINGGKNAVGGTATYFYKQPWFWTAAGAAILAGLGFMTWKRIGGWGRATVIVLATIALTVVLMRLK